MESTDAQRVTKLLEVGRMNTEWRSPALWCELPSAGMCWECSMDSKPTFCREHCPPELKACPDYLVSTWRDIEDLYVIGATLSPTNIWAEFGVGTGISARRLMKLLDNTGTLYLFDGWEGLPDDWHLSPAKVNWTGSYKFDKPRFKDKRVCFIDGWFADTLPYDFPGQLGLINIDCDVYSSTRTVLAGITPWVGSGTVMIFDELIGYTNYAEHEYKALMEWLDDTGHRMEWIGKERFGAVGVIG